MAGRHHECELYTGGLPEAEESEHNWKTCQKNPGHTGFLSAPVFVNNYLARFRNDPGRVGLAARLELTVRIRVRFTSLDRPDGGNISDMRGTDKLRVGTGFICGVKDPVFNKPCPCVRCGGKTTRKHWGFTVETAKHVVYNTEEAKNTMVDLFYDDTDSDLDGRMKSVRGLTAALYSEKDKCYMFCVTCDEGLGERLESAFSSSTKGRNWLLSEDLHSLGLLQASQRDRYLVLVVSHPHGQPKQVTLGELRHKGKDKLRQYTTATCPGSSGAPVFVFHITDEFSLYDAPTIHNGSYSETSTERCDRPSLPKRLFDKLRGHKTPLPQQLNYGFSLF